MTRTVLAVGAPGAGKSLLLARLARWLGAMPRAAAAAVGRPAPDGTPDGASAGVSDGAPDGEPSLYVADCGGGPLRRRLCLLDTLALTDEIAAAAATRRGQAQTLRRLITATVVLHVVDAASVGEAGTGVLTECDRLLARWGQGRRGYVLVAAQMDRPWAMTGVAVLRRHLAPPLLLPVAAACDQGLGHLRAVVRRYL